MAKVGEVVGLLSALLSFPGTTLGVERARELSPGISEGDQGLHRKTDPTVSAAGFLIRTSASDMGGLCRMKD